MAPELALDRLRQLPADAIVLDPMAGSGTVLRQATGLGLRAMGFDMDPLAVLMTTVWTSGADDSLVATLAKQVSKRAGALAPAKTLLPWMDHDAETCAFVDFWFAEPQKADLRRLAQVLGEMDGELDSCDERLALDLLRIALSRLVITKDRGASLARDVSHSRPHKVDAPNDFRVLPMFDRSVNAVRKRLAAAPPPGGAKISIGDARNLAEVADGSVDGVLTSPPYLNAIDYMRGHRLSLVWLGHRLKDLRAIRSNSIGAERGPERRDAAADLTAMRTSMGEVDKLPSKFSSMIDRYVQDIRSMVREAGRVLKPGGRATFVVGNSCLRGVFVRNSEAVSIAAIHAGLRLADETERPLPQSSRYLPMTSDSLGKRMRTETILSFERV